MKNVEKAELEQFPVDEILNEEDRLVRGWLSVEVKDKQGEVIPVSELRKTLNTWMKRGGFITDAHTNRVVGKAIRWFESMHPITKKPGIVIDYQIFKDYSIDDEVWKEIKRGIRRGLSFGGRALGKTETKVVSSVYGSPEQARVLHGLEAYEVATVKNPANPFAENIAVNFLAKGDEENMSEKEDLIKDLAKGFEYIDIQKPFAGFENFNECVLAQKKRGHSEESAKRICGWLKARTEKQVLSHTTYRGIDIFESPDGFYVTDLRQTFRSLNEAKRAIDSYLGKGEKMEMRSEVLKPKDKRPPKAWWDRIVRRLSQTPGVKDPERLAGWVFYHHLKTRKSEDPYPEITEEMLKEKADDRITATARRRKRAWLRAQKESDYNDWTDEEIDDLIEDALEEWNNLEESEEEEKTLKVEETKLNKGEMMEENKNEPSMKQDNPETPTESALKPILEEILSLVRQLAGTKTAQSPEGGEVKLPLATSEEVQQKKIKPASDEVSVQEKQEKPEEEGEEEEKAVKRKEKKKEEIREILKELGFKIEGRAGRPETEVAKAFEPIKDLGLELLQKAREGKITMAEMNREIKKAQREAREEAIRRVLGG